MFGRNDFIENIKDALAAAGCDMGHFAAGRNSMTV